MSIAKPLSQYAARLPQLVVAVVIFWGLSTNTEIGATNTSAAALSGYLAKHSKTSAAGQDIANKVQVLSPKQADLYRAIFAAQASDDWSTADRIIASLDDKRLMGHVLADRYDRRMGSLEELRTWLVHYSALPEADDIYDDARAWGDTKAVSLPKPSSGDEWTGGNTGASDGFKSEGKTLGTSHAMWENGLKAWKKGDNAAASTLFAKLSTQHGLTAWDRAAAAFWAYRSLKRAGNIEQANYWLHQAANEPRSFYGLLANDLLGKDGDWSWQLPELNDQRQAILATQPAGWRALALVQVGHSDLAEDELNHLNPQGRRDLQQAMLSLAEAAHMPSLALRLGGMAVNDNGKPYDAALYPLPPWQPVKGFEVDRALLFALMRHESQFDPVAVSGRGACGLMQLMPATAQILAKKTPDETFVSDCTGHLLDPTTNLSFGQTYVKLLADQPLIGDNLLLLLASYNSGPNRVAHWMNDGVKRDPLFFIESLPVRETRDYMQQVFIQYAMYRARLGQSDTAVTSLAKGEWPRYALRDGAPTLPGRREVSLKSIKVASR